MARAPSSAGTAREESSLSSCPVASARSHAWVANSARYMFTNVAPVYSSPQGMVNDDDNRESSPHACSASPAARRS